MIQPITNLKGVGTQVAQKLSRLHIESITDLLFHLPSRYLDKTRLVPIQSLEPDDYALIEGNVVTQKVLFKPKRQLQVLIEDASGRMQVKFFHFHQGQVKQMVKGQRIRCFGQVKRYRSTLMMVHPEYQLLQEQHIQPVEEGLTPIYPITDGVSQVLLRKLIKQVLAMPMGQDLISELIPKSILHELDLPSLMDALKWIHAPSPDVRQETLLNAEHLFQKRLAFEELLAYQLTMREQRQAREHFQSYALTVNSDTAEPLLENLPFELTDAQTKALKAIEHDIARLTPMRRLIQGDVGSGKTIVAAISAWYAIASGHQAALMAPTEILSEQHFQYFKQLFEPLGVKVTLLTGSLSGKKRRGVLEDIKMGLSQLIVGTHAIFQEGVDYKNLALVIIDEQHRFGVHQRLALQDKGKVDQKVPHHLILTATPIPRTLAMTFYADLDCSVIDTLPPGRQPITTVVISESKREALLIKVKEQIQEGRQIYWVCPLVEESEKLECQAVENLFENIKESLPDVDVGLVHGRLKAQEKEQVMKAFSSGQTKILVATTVIEVGVNVPNATLMIIENAERFGLAQIHQLRGRVGRGEAKSYCILMYQGQLSKKSEARLSILRDSQDGFKIAEEDLAIRGAGEILGSKQTGDMTLKIANLHRDKDLLPKVSKAADEILLNYPDLIQHLKSRWIKQSECAEV